MNCNNYQFKTKNQVFTLNTRGAGRMVALMTAELWVGEGKCGTKFTLHRDTRHIPNRPSLNNF